MQAVAADSPATPEEFHCFFREESFKQFVFNSSTLEQALS